MKTRLPVILLAITLLLSSGLALMWGATELGPSARDILWQLRLPRILLAAFTGMALALAGLLLQDFFRNPLVEPGLLGVSSGAGLAAVIVISFGFLNPWLLPLAAFVGALAALSLVVLLGQYLRGGVTELLLAGVAINALTGALVNLLLSLSDSSTLRSATFWMMGSFAQAEWQLLLPASGFLVLATVGAWRHHASLDVWQLGESDALHLGLDTRRFRCWLIGAASLLVALAVAQSGGIGFIGLLAPHIARRSGYRQHRSLIPATLCIGAILAVVADLLARQLISPLELPVGVLTALLGAPAFLLLFLRRSAV